MLLKMKAPSLDKAFRDINTLKLKDSVTFKTSTILTSVIIYSPFNYGAHMVANKVFVEELFPKLKLNNLINLGLQRYIISCSCNKTKQQLKVEADRRQKTKHTPGRIRKRKWLFIVISRCCYSVWSCGASWYYCAVATPIGLEGPTLCPMFSTF